MKVKVVAAALIAANFTFTTVAQAQFYGGGGFQASGGFGGGYTPGVGMYGGNVPCGYSTQPASGATAIQDKLALLLEKKAGYEEEYKKITGRSGEVKRAQDQLDKAREALEGLLLGQWARIFMQHMDDRMNCEVCGGDSTYQPPMQPPVQPPAPPLPPPTVVASPVVPPPQAAPQASDPNEPVRVARPPRSLPSEGDGDVDRAAIDACIDRNNAVRNAPKWKSSTPQQREEWCRKNPGRVMSKNDDPTWWLKSERALASENGGRMPASVSGGRAPASYTGGELGTSGSRPPVSSSSDVPSDDSQWWKSAEAGQGRSHDRGGRASCYKSDVEGGLYASNIWRNHICQPKGHINPDVCRNPSIIATTRDASQCMSALNTYYRQVDLLDKKQARARELEDLIAGLEEDIDALKNPSEDDIIIAEAKARREQRGQMRSGPSFGQALLGIGLGLAGGYGAYSLIHGQERKAYNNYLDAQTALGWQAMPYRDSGAGIAAGLGVFSGITGGLMGAYGCGQMSMGGMNGGIFGNPYATNPYAMMGGGMYNGAGPWGMSGPWGIGGMYGNPMMNGGFGFGAGMGGGFGMPGMGGYNPYGMGMGYPGGFGIGGGIGGGFGMPGMMGGYPYGMSGYPGMMGGYPGMYPGMGSMYPGMGSMYPGSSMYPGMGSMYPGMGGYNPYEQQMRASANQQGLGIQYGQLSNLMTSAQQQMYMLQSQYGGLGGYGGYGGYSPYGYSPYGSSYGGLGAYGGFNFQLGGGVGSYNPYSYPYSSYPSYLYSPSISPATTILPSTTTTVPTRTR